MKIEYLLKLFIASAAITFIMIPACTEGVQLEYYSMHWAPQHTWDMLAGYGINVIVTTMDPGGDEAAWAEKFELASMLGIRLIVSLWPLPYQMRGQTADVTRSMRFLEFVKRNPHYRQRILALYGVDEPFWQGCYGCGWTTAQMIDLRKKVRSVVPDMKMYYDIGNLEFWEKKTRRFFNRLFHNKTWIDDAAFDYVSVYYDKKSIGRKLQKELMESHEVIAGKNSLDRKLNIRLTCMMNTYKSSQYDIEMPDEKEMLTYSEQAIQSGMIHGYGFYPWFMDIYEDNLSQHAELWPVIGKIFQLHSSQFQTMPESGSKN